MKGCLLAVDGHAEAISGGLERRVSKMKIELSKDFDDIFLQIRFV